MRAEERIRAVLGAIEAVETALRSLAETGADLPAVERNARRMAGTILALKAQFLGLADEGNGEPQ